MKQAGLTIGTTVGAATVMARTNLMKNLVGLAIDADSKEAVRLRSPGE